MKDKLLLSCLYLLAFVEGYAQPGSLDLSFNPGDVGFGNGDGANSGVYAVAIQSDGKILIGGSFTTYNGTARSCIARLNSDGSLDASFNPGSGANNTVRAIAVQSDGKILIGGNFTSYNGTGRNYVARLNSDGSLDGSFTPGTGANSTIWAIALQSDGKILLAGEFTLYNGTGRNRIVRVNADGSLDTGFDPGTGANNTVYTLAVQSDGKIVLGGTFTNYNGTGRNRVVRVNVDGSLDTSFSPGTGANNTVWFIVLQSDGKIFIGGEFTSYAGTGRNRIARLNSNGSLDTGFAPGTGANGIVYSIAIRSDGKVLIGGAFTTYAGTGRVRIARVNPDGSLDGSFNPGTGASNTLHALVIQSDGKIPIGGFFTSYDGLGRNYVARVNTDGSHDTGFNAGTGANSGVGTIALQPDGKILIGGTFTSYENTSRNRIARLNSDGSVDTGFDPGTGANNTVSAIAVQTDGKIVIGGAFINYNGVTRNCITRLNSGGTLDVGFTIGTGANNTVLAIAIQTDGKILIGGSFTSYAGTGRNRIARLNANGTLDTGFNPGTGANGSIYAIAVQPDGKILIGGFFTSYNGTSRNYIARLNSDGSLDTSFDPGSGANSLVYALAIQPDGKILLGGAFSSYNGIGRNRIARVNSNGSLDSSFAPGTGANSDVRSIELLFDGKIVIGGAFTAYNGTGRSRIAQINPGGSLDFGFNPGIGANATISTLKVQPDGRILMGGEFTEYDYTGRNRIARLNGSATCIVTINSILVTHEGCPGASDGTITINATCTDCPGALEYSIDGGGSFQSGNFFSGLSPGAYSIQVRDASAPLCSATGSATVNSGVDSAPPVALCKNVTVSLDGFGNATISAAAINNGSWDNCSIAAMTVSPNAVTCAHVGANTVTLTVTDIGGNIATCTATATVQDTLPPTALCQDVTVSLDGTGNGSTSAAAVDNGSTDNCGIASLSVSPSAFTCANIGPNTVTLTVTDVNSNSATCTATATVQDDLPPSITCPAPVTVTCASLIPAVHLASVVATDNCGTPTKTFEGAATSDSTCVNRKIVTRTYRATDGSGNSSTCTHVITVFDNVQPVFTSVPAHITLQCNSPLPPLGNPAATDGCGGVVSIAYDGLTVTPGGCINAYTLTRQWTATDVCSNTRTATQQITVIDTQRPNFTSTPANITVQCSAIPAPATPTATDNCDTSVDVVYDGQTQTPGSCANAYTLTRRWTAYDNCGNTRTVTQRITVIDTQKPYFTSMPADITIQCSDPVPPVGTPMATDGCGSATVQYLGQTTANSVCPGTYQIRRTWRATDLCGNSTASTQIIQVMDNTPPVFTSVPGPITINCNDPLPPLVSPTATDACSPYVHITFLGNTPSGSGCAADYTIIRTWRADDLCGNSATATQVITVKAVPFSPGDVEERDAAKPQPQALVWDDDRLLTLQPNPTTDRVLIGLGSFAGERVLVAIHNDMGQLIWERAVDVVPDLLLSVSLRESGASAGLYTVSVRSSGRVVAKRLVLIE